MIPKQQVASQWPHGLWHRSGVFVVGGVFNLVLYIRAKCLRLQLPLLLEVFLFGF